MEIPHPKLSIFECRRVINIIPEKSGEGGVPDLTVILLLHAGSEEEQIPFPICIRRYGDNRQHVTTRASHNKCQKSGGNKEGKPLTDKVEETNWIIFKTKYTIKSIASHDTNLRLEFNYLHLLQIHLIES